VAWKHYFQSKHAQVNIVCFTAFPKDENERKSQQEKGIILWHQVSKLSLKAGLQNY
jgi:hypothetical protein